MKYIDTHTHTNYGELIDQFENIISEIEKIDMYINIVGNNINDSQLAINQSYKSNNTYATIGVHPNEFNNDIDIKEVIDTLEQMYINNQSKIIAIGEIGLDYYNIKNNNQIDIQKQLFEEQIKLAIKLNLPIVLHIRDAHIDAYNIIKKYNNAKFVVHCFTGNVDDVNRYLQLNCYISFSGIVTFNKKTEHILEALKNVPLSKLLTETDAPWLAPVPMRGKTNFPQYVLYTNSFIAQTLNLDIDKLNQILVNNAINFFNLNYFKQK